MVNRLSSTVRRPERRPDRHTSINPDFLGHRRFLGPDEEKVLALARPQPKEGDAPDYSELTVRVKPRHAACEGRCGLTS